MLNVANVDVPNSEPMFSKRGVAIIVFMSILVDVGKGLRQTWFLGEKNRMECLSMTWYVVLFHDFGRWLWRCLLIV
jgi:hypothetical protein